MSDAARTLRPALHRTGLALAALHGLVAAGAWWRALARGAGQVDVVSAAYALLLSALVVALVATWPVAARRGSRAGAAWVAAALLALPVEAWLALRSAEPRTRYEVGLSSGLYDAPDGAFRWSLMLAEPFSAGQHALLQLERDGRQTTRPLALRRSARDNIAAGAPGLALRPLGAGRYWLVVGTAWVRGGPQFFLIDWPDGGQAPRVEEIARGLTVEDGRARWDCAVWDPAAHEAPEPGSLCGADGTLPPVRACRLARLAAECGPGLAVAAGCQPELAGDDPAVLACLARRAEAGDPLAWDARVLVTAVSHTWRPLGELLARSLEQESARDPRCAALRHGARQLAAGRRLGRWWEWVALGGARELLAARAQPGADAARCEALPPVAAELARGAPELAWDAVRTARIAGQGEASCRDVLVLAARGDLARLGASERREAEAWRAECAAREAVRQERGIEAREQVP